MRTRTLWPGISMCPSKGSFKGSFHLLGVLLVPLFAEVLYVDKEKPGWDCTVTKPVCWKRAKEAPSVLETELRTA